jgi:Ca-activated chloride channel family protein
VFDSNQISEYRLIGFDNKRDAVQDTSSDMDGGEIGSGGSTMALFEIIPSENYNTKNNFGKLNLKFHKPHCPTNEMLEINYDIPSVTVDSATNGEKFATAVAMFGLKLKESLYLKNVSWNDIKIFAESAADRNNFLQKDFLKLLDKTIKIYEPNKKSKKNKREKKED